MPRHLWVMLAAALLPVAASGAEGKDAFAGWPQNWVDSYRRFEKFIAEQKKYIPPSGLEILPDGQILTTLPQFKEREHHTSILFYRIGVHGHELLGDGKTFQGRRRDRKQPGIYAGCMQTVGILGYQYVHPLVWFQTTPPTPGDSSQHGKDERISIRMIDQPQPAQDFWPNDRLFSYCDFQVFPHTNPLEFFQANNKVAPSVTLGVTRDGFVKRGKLDAALEPLLRWRIYHDGRLIEKGSASGDLHHEAGREVGGYVVFVGVDGPNGFMPVSNFLQFPLFPEKAGGRAVLPTVSNSYGFPDFLLDVLTPRQVEEVRATESWARGGGYYSATTIYGLNSQAEVDDLKKQDLLSLWSYWSWSVREAKENPGGELNRIHMALDEK